MRGGSKVLIATAAASATSHDEAIAGVREIVKQFARIVVVNYGSHGNWRFGGRSFASRAIATFAVTPALARVLRIKPEMKQGVVVLAGNQNDIAPAPAIAAARPTAWDVFLAPERQASIPAVARLHTNSNFVDEHGSCG
jgi:hypothetical protein